MRQSIDVADGVRNESCSMRDVLPIGQTLELHPVGGMPFQMDLLGTNQADQLCFGRFKLDTGLTTVTLLVDDGAFGFQGLTARLHFDNGCSLLQTDGSDATVV